MTRKAALYEGYRDGHGALLAILPARSTEATP